MHANEGSLGEMAFPSFVKFQTTTAEWLGVLLKRSLRDQESANTGES